MRIVGYRSKDVVEKGFDVLKNEIELMPTNLRTNNSLRGYLFVAFLALILRMKLTRLMVNAELNKRYSVEGLLTELEKIKMMILPDGEKITTEITKKQREILDALHRLLMLWLYRPHELRELSWRRIAYHGRDRDYITV